MLKLKSKLELPLLIVTCRYAAAASCLALALALSGCDVLDRLGGHQASTTPRSGEDLGESDGDASLALGACRPGALFLANRIPLADESGRFATFSTAGAIGLTGPFFQSFGTNGRTCGSCHDPAAAWTITPDLVQQRFNATAGLDPIFRPVDGSGSPNADVSTVAARRAAYAILLAKGVIRIGLPVPAGAEFALSQVDDPYGFASASQLSLFRRPLPATNLPFLSTVMWDGRESQPGRNLVQALMSQANDATLTHAQGQPLSVREQEALVAFETTMFSAQVRDAGAGSLTRRPADGGPVRLSRQGFALGINNPGGGRFNPDVFDLFDGWLDRSGTSSAQGSIARGERIFNELVFSVAGVRGLNDLLGQPTVQTTCSGCHNAPNVGGSSVQGLFDIGLSDGGQRTPDMPLYTLQNLATGETIATTDPGRALITGKWADVDRFKVPSLRGLAARAPYFHNGSIPTLEGVVAFYNQRFQIGLSAQDAADLAAFLGSL